MHLMIGTRHLGVPADPDGQVEAALDGRVIDRWTTSARDPNVLRFIDLPSGVPGAGDYATLTISSSTIGGGDRRAEVAVRQFDAQDAARPIFGFGEGWHELEFEVVSGRTWRWSSDRSVLRVHGPPRSMRLELRGESPLRYFDAPPRVTVSAAGQVVGQFSPGADFEWGVTIPMPLMAKADGTITLALDRAYLPGAAEGTSDARRLGLRLFDLRLYPVSP
jgi:hypothetical protein